MCVTHCICGNSGIATVQQIHLTLSLSLCISLKGTLNVRCLYPSDISLVTSDGFTLLMKAVLGNQPSIVRDLLSLPGCPKDFRQFKVSLAIFIKHVSACFKRKSHDPLMREGRQLQHTCSCACTLYCTVAYH